MFVRRRGIWQLNREPSCLAYYDADLPNVVLNNGNVSLWRNSSSIYTESARDAAQATAVNQPIYLASDPDFGGHGSLEFPGPRLLTTGTWSAPVTTGTEYYVVKFASALSTNRLIDGSASGRHITMYASGGLSMYLSASIGGTAGSANLLAVICSVYNGASSAIYMNDMTTPVATGNPGSSSTSQITIGGDYAGAYYWGGKVTCIGMFSSIDSSTERTAKGRWLGRKYGISVT